MRPNAWLAGWLLGAGLLVAAGCGGVVPLPPTPASADYRIQPGDTMQFVLRQEQVMPRPPLTLTVQPDGVVMVPYVGAMAAAGKTTGAFQQEIWERLKGVFSTPTSAHLSINVYPGRVVQVLGFVRSPGQFPLVHGMRATDALALAGGLRHPESSPNATVLLRGGGEENAFPVYFSDILAGDPTTNHRLLPGDVIYVPPTTLRKVAFFIEDLFAPIHALLAPIVGPATTVVGA